MHATGPALMWSITGNGLTGEVHPDLAGALAANAARTLDSTGSLLMIETAVGTITPSSPVVQATITALSKARLIGAGGDDPILVEVMPPTPFRRELDDTSWEPVSSHRAAEFAEAAAQRMRNVVGKDRVRVVDTRL